MKDEPDQIFDKQGHLRLVNISCAGACHKCVLDLDVMSFAARALALSITDHQKKFHQDPSKRSRVIAQT